MNTSLKTCFKCGAEKPIAEFYAHKQMADGHLNKCKSCTKLDVAMRYRDPSSRERINAYEKDRSQRPDRKAKAIVYQREMRKRHPDRYRARTAVSNALKFGRMTKQPCEICGSLESQAHHNDYRYPLAVRWLCFAHHRQLAHSQLTQTTTK